jgi:transcriptional regulator
MYTPAAFEETRSEVLHQLIADHPLGTLVTLGPDGLVANHIPFLLDHRSGEHGTLIGHVARNNDVWRVREGDPEVLVVFQSVDGYITPNWYASKRETHQVVPTWNYAVVHAYGPLMIHEDPKWLRGVVGRLTKHFEADQPTPWKMADAPSDYIASQLDHIVGIEIPISRLIGKWKTSQNRLPADRKGVVAGLQARDQPGDATMAELVQATLTRS